MSTIEEIVGQNHDAPDALIAALTDREDKIADNIRMAAIQFGAMPQFTAKVLMDLGLGSPVSEEQRALIDAQFLDTINQMREQVGLPALDDVPQWREDEEDGS